MNQQAQIPPLKLAVIPVTPFQQNCSLIVCTKTSKAAFVDPGGDLAKLKQAISQLGVEIEKILITHGHIDHCGQAGIFAKELGVPIEGPHEGDRFWISRLTDDKRGFGIEGETFEPDRWLVGGDQVTVGEVTLDVYHCPGHTPGHVVFHHPESKLAIVGDVLFQGSVGRTDFPMSNSAQLIESIRTQLWPLGDDVTFIPGHGAHSNFGHERRTNPFCGDAVTGFQGNAAGPG